MTGELLVQASGWIRLLRRFGTRRAAMNNVCVNDLPGYQRGEWADTST
jgi:hypothetical protein